MGPRPTSNPTTLDRPSCRLAAFGAALFLCVGHASGQPQRTVVEELPAISWNGAGGATSTIDEMAPRQWDLVGPGLAPGRPGEVPLRRTDATLKVYDNSRFAWQPQMTTAPEARSFDHDSIVVGCGFRALGQQSIAYFWPPDPTVAVGPGDVVLETVNSKIRATTRTGSFLWEQDLFDYAATQGFFTGGGTPFDPRCIYDQYSGRFIVIALEIINASTSYIDIAISRDSNPVDEPQIIEWYKYRTPSAIFLGGANLVTDFTGLGVDANVVYVTANLFAGAGAGAFGGVKYRMFDKSALLVGTSSWLDIDVGLAAMPVPFASVQPAHCFGVTGTPFFVATGPSPTMIVQAMTNPLTSPVLFTAQAAVPAFVPPALGSGAPQMGTAVTLDVSDGRVLNAVWRNGSLYTAHAIDLGGQFVARWYQFGTGNFPSAGLPVLQQSGTLNAGIDAGGAPIHTFYPVIAVNQCNSVGIVFARSSLNEVPSIYATGRGASDPVGSMDPMAGMMVSTCAGGVVPRCTGIPQCGYVDGGCASPSRWGDYFGIAVDPLDGRKFWGVGEYYNYLYDPVGGWISWIGCFTVRCSPGSSGT